MMELGTLRGDLGVEVGDLLVDLVGNQAAHAREFFAKGSEAGAYPVAVMNYEGVFFVRAPQFEDVTYFLSEDDAVCYAKENWDGLFDTEEEASEE
jgi:hypothetical protein